MLPKLMNENGQKAFQRVGDKEDRSLPYRDWLRTVECGGFFMDIDFLKWKKVDGELKPVAITELTRCDNETAGPGYLVAIVQRYFYRDRQGQIIEKLASLLNVPAYLVLFQKDMKWVWILDFKDRSWKEYKPEEWAEVVKNL